MARNGDDTLTVASLEDSFRAIPTLQGDVGDDTLRWQDDSLLGIAGTSRDMSIEMERVFIDGDLELLGGGTLSVTATTELSDDRQLSKSTADASPSLRVPLQRTSARRGC